jgi:ABC-type transport system involved in cytochrome c biogenesis permease subunit
MKHFAFLMVMVAAMAAPHAYAQSNDLVGGPKVPTWDPEVVELFASLPIQDAGRVKPVDTYAGFLMLRLNGKRSFRRPEELGPKDKIGPTEWLLDTMFYPDIARQYEIFIVNDSAVLDAIGVDHSEKKKRDRYSFAELAPGIPALGEKWNDIARVQQIPPEEQTPLQMQLVQLHDNIAAFQMATSYFDFARMTYPVRATEGLRIIFPEDKAYGFSDILQKMPLLITLAQGLNAEGSALDEAKRTEEREAVNALAHQFDAAQSRAMGLALMPPLDAQNEDPDGWFTPTSLAEVALKSQVPLPEQLALLADLEAIGRASQDMAALQTALGSYHERVSAVAEERGEYGAIPLEVMYYKAKLLSLSLYLYIFSFFVVAFLWMRPSNRLLGGLAHLTVACPTILLIAAIAIRCIIRGRPPVSTLYETVLFITATAVVACLFIEAMNKQRIALSLGSLLGALGLFLAYKYEIKEGVDTMPNLQAVLDTNFWLATHVTTVTMGYAAGLLAAGIAHIYILGKFLNLKSGDPQFYKTLTRMTYGVICFGLLFATVGTILGGIWANDSWGRFWGWDPKENGALMIVLCGLIILHARMGGYIRDLGIAICAVITGMVVAFSWWGVNLLGVGLHAYGFTQGVWRVLVTFWVLQGLVAGLGVIVYWKERALAKLEKRVRAELKAEEAPAK